MFKFPKEFQTYLLQLVALISIPTWCIHGIRLLWYRRDLGNIQCPRPLFFFFQASGLLKGLGSCPVVYWMEGILNGESVGRERALQIPGVRTVRRFCLGIWMQVILTISPVWWAWGDGWKSGCWTGVRRTGSMAKGCCMTDC